ncbi:endo-1,4-beta-xylanase A precursor [Ruminiclostridium hungatei]|uniref:Endo-1,4-beta-xylanase A n=1 Tax=Ruminiclostridium hungatei TaxID=48256 RepID=A0A1V4SP40_RUMHU|nr:S-layer homology domain-containing protein [Ruminiclostridium hungatei]OPX45620.1 endo-1,4-beta-xylanase A precursor [Ruminiclostridium hungatei]
MKKLCFAVLLSCLIIFSGMSCIFAEDYIDGGVNMDATAPLLANTLSYIKTYGGAVGEPIYFRLIPTSTENYTIETVGTVDTAGQLYNGDGTEYGDPEDDLGETDYNFRMNKLLEAGKLYYLGIVNYSYVPGDKTILQITGDSGGGLVAPAVITMTDPGKKLIYKGGDTIRISGTVADGNGDNVAIYASIGSKPATVTVTGGNGPWALEWDIDGLNIAENIYKDVTVTADDGSPAGPATAIHTGDIVVDRTAPTAPTSVSVTPIGGTVVANTLNKSNTNLIAGASIIAADATGGKAELYLGSTLLATDNTITDTDTQVTFDLSITSTENLQSAIPTGGIISVKLYDEAGNSSSSTSNPTLLVDYVAPPPEAPTATVQPITGNLKVWETLTGHYTYSDINGDLQGATTFKWYRADDSAGSGKTAISGAAAITYILQPEDLGKYISFEVTPVAATGIFTQGTAVESARTGAVAPAEAAPVATVQPITGTLKVGETLTGHYTYSDINGDSQGATIFKWYRADDSAGSGKTAISGATAITYILQPEDLGKYISFEVTPVAATGITQGTAVESARTGAVAPAEAAPVATVQPITGTLKVGETLTGHYIYSDINGDSEGVTTFKWYRADNSAGSGKTAISGATAITYILQEDDLGKYISFEVTPVAVTGITQGTAVESARTGAVAPAEAAPTATVSPITGILKVGETLTGHYTYSDINGDSEGVTTFKWYRADDSAGSGKTAISGATAITYILKTEDQDKYISFEVTPVATSGILQGVAVESASVAIIITNAAPPGITVQPQNRTVNVGDTAGLSITATASGILSYQWYSSTQAAIATGAELPNATGAAIQLQTNTAGTRYYYCVLTNTDNSMTGVTTASTTSAIAQVTVNNAPATPYTPTPDTTPQKEKTPRILINGKELNLETITTSEHGGETIIAISIDSQKLEKKLDSEQEKSVITIPLGEIKADAGILTGDIVKELENNQAIFEISNGNATYILPAKVIDIDTIAEQLDSEAALSDIKVKIKVSKASAESEERLKRSAEIGKFSIEVAPVDFSIECSVNNKTIAVNNFSGYVERTLKIPENADPDKITTGVVVDPDGTVRHVPTAVINIEGKYYAKINSLTNSPYAVIYHPVEYADASKTPWAKAAINDIGSRLVITNGIENNMFYPKNQITRAEFAAIIINALGLKPETGKNLFKDVNEKQWYSGHINTAYKYGLISGKGSNTFAPEDKITREHAMIIIAKAMVVVGLDAGITDEQTGVILSGYKDAASITQGARYSVAACVKAGLVTGKENSLIAPKQYITRAEIAVIIQNLLKKSGLI